MNTYATVRQEHLNHHGYLFGGYMLLWVDEYAWLTAARDYRGCRMITRAMDSISFDQPVPLGAILRFCILPERKGKTSVSYRVTVYADAPGAAVEKEVFSTAVTFVRVSEDGAKRELPDKSSLKSEEID